MQVSGPKTRTGVSAGGKAERQNIFSEMSVKQKNKLYLEVLKHEKLTAEDKGVLLQHGAYTGWHGTESGSGRPANAGATRNRLNSRAVLVTYQSKKL